MKTLELYLEHLQELVGIESHQQNSKPELLYDATITLSGNHRLFVHEYRSHLTYKTVDHIIAQSLNEASQPMLLLAPSIGAPLGAMLAKANINYLDRAGNCHIVIGNILLHVEGRRTSSKGSSSKGLRSAGYQVIFAFLAEPSLINASIRTIASAAGVSRQPVSDTRRRLLDEAYIIKTNNCFRWIPGRQSDALSLWLHGYETTVRPSLIHGTYRSPDASPQELEERIISTLNELNISRFRWGGNAAEYRLMKYYRGKKTTLHLHAAPNDLRRQLGIIPDPQGNLVLMNAFGELNWRDNEETVHPLLVHAEMLRDNSERANEAAQEFFESYIQPIWK